MSGQRIVSIDFWRGLALLTIFVDHIPGNPLERATYRNFGFSDAAEIFVFLAGTAAALAYMRGLGSDAPRTTIKVGLRAFTLYTSHLAVVIACGAVIAYAVLATGDSRFLANVGLDTLTAAPLHAMIGIATLGFQPGWMNILPLYVVLLLMAPVLLSLARKSPWLALGASATLYLATQLFGLHLPTYPAQGGWFFNPLAWQLLFTLGICLGSGMIRGLSMPRSRVLVGLAAGYAVLAAVWAHFGPYAPWDLRPVPPFLWDFDKTNLSLPRLLHVAAVVYLIAQLPVIETRLRLSAIAKPFIVLGRHSLPVFCVGTVLAITLQIVRATLGTTVLTDLLLLGAGALLQIGLAWALEWYGSASKSRERAVPAAAPLPLLSR
ncbi:MAG TPA: OpgC domain-containing protein [Hyphomicrobiales bacterium]|nr:OpgC domain-containing protein [Hyphomicrobiales bacterium]